MRSLPEEPPSRAALWSRRLACGGVACAAGAVAASHTGWLRPPAALGLLAAGLVLALVSIVLAAGAAVVIWRTGRRGVPSLLAGLALSVLLLAGPAVVGLRAAHRPMLNDVSTDLVDPPAFAASPAAVAARDGALHAADFASTGAAQTAAYPDVQPLMLDLPPAAAYAAVLKLVKARHWRVLASSPPGAAPGHVEAVARTPVMAFRDDVAIRITPASAERTRVDMRSAARFGRGDLGVNAARIEAFLGDLEEAAGAS